MQHELVHRSEAIGLREFQEFHFSLKFDEAAEESRHGCSHLLSSLQNLRVRERVRIPASSQVGDA